MSGDFTRFFYNIVFSVLLLSCLFYSEQAQATHAVGVDLDYSCQGGNQYKFRLNLYRDCEGISAPSSAVISISSASCGISTSITLSRTSFSEVSPVCASQLGNSACNGGSLPGIERHIYEGTYTFPQQCTDWRISYSLCCRNNAITNLSSPGSQNLYVEAMLNNTLPVCNNSPIFSNLPVPYLCEGQEFNYNHGVIDVDGDSLHYSLVNPLDGPGANIPYNGGFTPTSPMNTSGPFNFNQQTGQMNFIAQGQQQAVVSVIVREFRNGQLVGTTMRDLQLIVLPCSNQLPTATGIDGSADYEIEICAGFPLCFDIFSNDLDPGQIVSMSWNNGIPDGSFNVGGGANPSATFCWTPAQNDIGPYTFSVSVEDDACPIPGVNNYTYTVIVTPNPNDPVDAGPDQIICQGETAQLNATTSAAGPLQYNWTPTTGLSCTTCQNPVANPTSTTTYQVQLTYPDACSSIDYVTVTRNPEPSVSVFPGQATLCSGDSIIITASSNNAVTFQWDNGMTGQSIKVGPTSVTTYTVQGFDADGCPSPPVSSTISTNPPPPAQVCNNIYVTTNGTGGGMSKSDPTDLLSAIAMGQCNNVTIKLATGTYNITEPISNISSYMTLEGGYLSGSNWTKTSQVGATTINRTAANPDGPANARRLVGFYINSKQYFRFQDITIQVANANIPQMSCYGVHLTGCSNYDFVRTRVISGNAGDGVSGTPGTSGSNGGNASGTTGGSGAVGIAGGTANVPGSIGSGLNGGGGGGLNASGGASNGGSVPGGTAGIHGDIGVSGTYGTAGPAGTYSGGFWLPGSFAPDGTDGTGGSGGGGSATGGGGGGGQGGTAGTGGNGGGGTFAVYLYDNGSNANFDDCELFVGDRGDGGLGGAGGFGGNGGVGSSGGGPGGPGANGGNGGWGIPGSALLTYLDGGVTPSTTDYNYNLTIQPVITATNVQCTNTPVDFTGPNSLSWNFGSGASPLTQTGANVSTQYTTIGRKNIQYGSDVYTGFINVAIDVTSFTPEITSTATQTSTDTFTVCQGDTEDMISPTPGIAYDWDMGGAVNPNVYSTQDVEDLTFNTPGAFTIKLRVETDCCGWSLPDSVTLIVETAPSIALSGDTFGCLGDPILVNLTGADNYNWSPNLYVFENTVGTYTINAPDTTNYTITSQNANGNCPVSMDVQINVNPAPGLTTSAQDATCSNDGSATVVATGGSGVYTYQWNSDANNQQTATATNLYSGNYSVTVTDAMTGCLDTAFVYVPSSGAPIAYISQSVNATCFGVCDGSATAATANGTGPFTYVWSHGPTTATVTNLCAGIYEVTSTDIVGCVSVANVTIAQPDSMFVNIFEAVGPFCIGDSTGYLLAQADGGSGGFIYQWNTNPISTGDSLGGLLAGTYVSIVTDANLCVVTDTAVLQDPPPLLGQIDITDESCYNSGDGALAAIPNGLNPITSYEWSVPSNDSMVTGLSAGEYYLTITDTFGCSITDTAIVNAPDSISVTPNITHISCYNANDGAIDLTVSGGTPSYNYSWSNGPNTPSVSGLSGGWYTVTITDANNCTWVDSFEIINPGEIILALDSIEVSCNGGANGEVIANIIGGGTSPFEYSIDGANYQSSNTFTGLSAGSYTVEVRDSNLCTADTFITVEEPTAIVFTLNGEQPSCLGYDDAIAFVETVSGGTPPYSYEWNTNPVQNNDTAFSLYAGTHTVTITDANGCTVVDSILITDPPGIQSNTSTTPSTCFYSDDGSASVSANGPYAITSYEWSDAFSQNTAQATGLIPGTYTVTVTDASGCFIVDTAIVTSPDSILWEADVVDISCYNEDDGNITISNVSGGAGNYTYSWSVSGSGNQITGLQEGNYSVTISDALGCTVEDNFTIVNPDSLTASVTTTPVSCNGGSDGAIQVQTNGGTMPFTFSLNGGAFQSSNIFDGLAIGTYQLDVLDVNNCPATTSGIINQPPPLNINTLGIDPICADGDDGLAYANASGGVGGFSYSWNTNPVQNNDTASGLSSGTYTVVATDANDCSIQEDVTLTDPAPALVSIDPDSVSLSYGEDADLQANPGGNTVGIPDYIWTPDQDINCVNCDLVNVSPLETTVYTVQITDQNGCQAEATITVFVDPMDKILYAPNAFTPNGDGVNDKFNAFALGVALFEMKIFNRWGELVFSTMDIEEGWDGYFKGELQNPDVFVYHVRAIYMDGYEKSIKGSLTLIR